MADNENTPKENVFSEDDTLDINELASLNDDITTEFIEQLQSQVSKTASQFTGKSAGDENDDSQLFEEVSPKSETAETETNISSIPARINIDANIDDNFIKKYKAKLNKLQQAAEEEAKENSKHASVKEPEAKNSESSEQNEPALSVHKAEDKSIEDVTSGNIIEKPITTEQKSYNDSLDLLDQNIKYSKYVIYIDPENTDFIESLTVKERKNLINKILREQDDIAVTKGRLRTVQTVIKHSIVAIITVAIAIPVIYTAVNASLEATINNHRRSQTLFQTLYKEHGKISRINNQF